VLLRDLQAESLRLDCRELLLGLLPRHALLLQLCRLGTQSVALPLGGRARVALGLQGAQPSRAERLVTGGLLLAARRGRLLGRWCVLLPAACRGRLRQVRADFLLRLTAIPTCGWVWGWLGGRHRVVS
jgi:hypothetical protein